jgi:hypothetical protein
MAEPDVKVTFGAQIDDLKDKIGEVQGIFKELTERFALVAAAVAGGAAFKEFIGETNQLNAEATKLSRTLGITGEDAGTLNTALGDIGSDADTYTAAFLKFNRQLRSNSDTMRALGVDVDGLRSGQKSSNEVFQEAIKIVGQYKPGVDQTQVAMQLFGRSVDDVQRLMKLSNEKLEEAKKKNQELNLVVTQEGVAASKAYKEAMNDVGDVLSGLKKTIGEAVMPLFTESAQRLASIGPTVVAATKEAAATFVEIWRTVRDTVGVVFDAIGEIVKAVGDVIKDVFGGSGTLTAMDVFRGALRWVLEAFIGFRVGVEEVVNVVRTGLQLLMDGFTTFAKVSERALSLDFAGAEAAFRAGIERRTRILEEGIRRAVEIAEKGKEDLDKAAGSDVNYGHEGRGSAPPSKTGSKRAPDFDKAGADKANQLAQARLALERANDEAALALQKEYLDEASRALDDAYKRNLISTKDYYDVRLMLEQAGIDAALTARRKELDEAKKAEGSAKDEPARLKFQAQEAKLLGEINVLEAKRVDIVRANAAEYRKAEQERQDSLKQIALTAEQSNATSEVANERSNLEQMKTLRQISAEDAFQIERQLEEKTYASQVAALAARQELVHGDAVKQAQLNADIEAAERDHQQRLNDIDRAAVLEREKYSIQAQQNVQSSFAKMVGDLLSGTKKVSDVFRQLGIDIANTFTNLIAHKFTDRLFDVTGINKAIDSFVNIVTTGINRMVTMWVGGEAAQTTAATSGAATRQGVKAAEAATNVAQKATETTAAVTSESAQTAAASAGDATRTATGEAATATAIASQQAQSVAAILGYAAEAAVAAMASVAAIPVVGWAMAPEVGAATYATGLAYLASAAGGYADVPEDQIAQIHKREMVLPASLATGLRKLVGDGGINPLRDATQLITAAQDNLISNQTRVVRLASERLSVTAANDERIPSQETVQRVANGAAIGVGDAVQALSQTGAATQARRTEFPTALPASLGAAGRLTAAPASAPSLSSSLSHQVVQNMVAAGIGKGLGAGPTINLNTIDARTGAEFLLRNGRGIAKSLERQGRNFVGVKGSV